MALDSQIQAVVDHLDELGGRPVATLTPAEARLQPVPADAVRALLWEEGTGLSLEPVGAVEDLDVPGPLGSVPVRIYWPLGAEPGLLPVLVYAHGGGWVLGDLDDYDATPRALTNRSGCIVVSVGYRRAPEHPFPAAHDDMLAVTEWVRSSIAGLSGDPARVAVGGEGAGATMAVATCRSLNGSGPSQVAFQLLLYPITDFGRIDGASYRAHLTSRPLGGETVEWFAGHVVAQARDLDDPRLSPARSVRAESAGLPPTLLITADADPLRDQGETFGRMLLDAGVKATTLRFEGVTHDFVTMNPVAAQAQRAVSTAAQHLRDAFGLRAPTAPTVGPDLAQVLAASHAGMRTVLARLAEGRGDQGTLTEQLRAGLIAHAEMEQVGADESGTGLTGQADMGALLRLSGPDAVDGPGFLAGVETVRAAIEEHQIGQERELADLRVAIGNKRMRALGTRAMATSKSSGGRRAGRAMAHAS